MKKKRKKEVHSLISAPLEPPTHEVNTLAMRRKGFIQRWTLDEGSSEGSESFGLGDSCDAFWNMVCHNSGQCIGRVSRENRNIFGTSDCWLSFLDCATALHQLSCSRWPAVLSAKFLHLPCHKPCLSVGEDGGVRGFSRFSAFPNSAFSEVSLLA